MRNCKLIGEEVNENTIEIKMEKQIAIEEEKEELESANP